MTVLVKTLLCTWSFRFRKPASIYLILSEEIASLCCLSTCCSCCVIWNSTAWSISWLWNWLQENWKRRTEMKSVQVRLDKKEHHIKYSSRDGVIKFLSFCKFQMGWDIWSPRWMKWRRMTPDWRILLYRRLKDCCRCTHN